MGGLSLLSLENQVFRCYLTYTSILVLKMMLMSILTSVQRRKHGVLTSPEDAPLLKPLRKSHDDVDRVRRAHLNDMENIPLFFVVGFTYILTNPAPLIASYIFRIYTVSRIIHTFVYAIYVIPQPARGLAWVVGYLVNAYMAVRTIITFATW
ncbi:hypothetical protein PPYR_01204 [Photinus pyralis]|uniref:Microsomal glutathione S-transferase 1 n=1 Tax=Photinus pyralis TaxID=7054 RepID=A0A5N4B3V7_PHOPY|nr:microsomal glutathione S-transferase 1-like [Photinus pyralis]KAB0804234.1 hypothetical protein PPYR_01204 [Photinus pyralis]